MTITVAYGCLILNLDGHKQAARILIDDGITLNEFKKELFGREKVSGEMKKLVRKLRAEMKKRKPSGSQ